MATGTKRARVVVAMSGGVDSSVAAALLVEQGYEVVGMMMRLWSEPSRGASAPVNRCCTPDQMGDARRVADKLRIPFYVLDVRDTFRQTIVQFFIDEHLQGRTPNPCIECNRQIRFTYLLEHALALDADYLATGHYARVRRTGGYRLLKGLDAAKDQSYVLHVLGQEQLAHVLFPVGEYTKAEVRELATRFGLPVASKQESQDLCFLGDGDYRRFLREHSRAAIDEGPILSLAGEELGRHEGLPFYTIGQRKGLGLSLPEPVYVIGKDVGRNAVIVGPRAALGQQVLTVRDVNWIAGTPPPLPKVVSVKIRYKARPVAGTVRRCAGGRAEVMLQEPAAGVTPGQGAVFFEEDACLGGGMIADTRQENVVAQQETAGVSGAAGGA